METESPLLLEFNLLLKQCQNYLTLRLWKKLVQCSEAILFQSPSCNATELRAVTFKTKALFGLAKYQEAVIFLETCIKQRITNPSNALSLRDKEALVKSLRNLQKEAEERSLQEKNGTFDMALFVPNRKVRFDFASEHKGPIEVKHVPGKGRGFFATEELRPGQLLVASRAFEIVFEELGDWTLEMAIAQRLRLEPEVALNLYQLHAGQQMGFLERDDYNRESDDKKMLIDMDRITGICDMNSFGNSKNLLGYGHDSRGLWILPSFVNHDCIDFNATWKCLGDFIFIRAIKGIPRGQEVLISYTDSTDCYEERLKFFEAHDFICNCRLCTFQSGQNPQLRLRKIQILKKVDEMSDQKVTPEGTSLLESFIKEMDKMGSSSKHPEWNFEIHVPLDLLAKFYYNSGDPRYKVCLERYYEVVNGRTCLELGAAGPVASYMVKGGDLQGARKWIAVLKKDLTLVYGESDVFRIIYPILWSEANKKGVKC